MNCPFNPMNIQKDEHCSEAKCKKCGWNPDVVEERKKKIREKIKEMEPKICVFLSEDEICVNAKCPICSNPCPVANVREICKWEVLK